MVQSAFYAFTLCWTWLLLRLKCDVAFRSAMALLWPADAWRWVVAGPVVALGFSVAPVAGQNVGAKLGARVREAYRSAAWLAAGTMVALAVIVNVAPRALAGIFLHEDAPIQVSTDYLRIVSWSFLASGVIFVNSSLFQALGRTWPSLASSALRLTAVLAPVLWLSTRPGFSLTMIWYLTTASIVLQLVVSSWLLRRELTRTLDHHLTH